MRLVPEPNSVPNSFGSNCRIIILARVNFMNESDLSPSFGGLSG